MDAQYQRNRCALQSRGGGLPLDNDVRRRILCRSEETVGRANREAKDGWCKSGRLHRGEELSAAL